MQLLANLEAIANLEAQVDKGLISTRSDGVANGDINLAFATSSSSKSKVSGGANPAF